MDEYSAFRDMAARYKSTAPAIFIADGGFCSIYNCAFFQQTGHYYLTRARNTDIQWYIETFHLGWNDIFDVSADVYLTRSYAVSRRDDGRLYRKVCPDSARDLLPPGSRDSLPK